MYQLQIPDHNKTKINDIKIKGNIRSTLVMYVMTIKYRQNFLCCPM